MASNATGSSFLTVWLLLQQSYGISTALALSTINTAPVPALLANAIANAVAPYAPVTPTVSAVTAVSASLYPSISSTGPSSNGNVPVAPSSPPGPSYSVGGLIAGLILGAVQMLTHIEHPNTSALIHNAWLRTIEDGVHTVDIFKAGTSKKKVGTREFTREVIARLGSKPQKLQSISLDAPPRERARELVSREKWMPPPQEKLLHGVDIFLEWRGGSPDALAERVKAAAAAVPGLKLTLITNRGVKVWPHGFKETFCTDHWRCRFRATAGDTAPTEFKSILQAMGALSSAGLDVIKSENLCFFRNVDGSIAPGFSLGQGE